MYLKKLLLLALVTLASPSQLGATAPPHLWSQSFGDSDPQNGRCVTTDASGNVILTGSFEGTIDLGGGTIESGGSNDFFLAKFDASGNHLWSRGFGDTDYDTAPSVVIDGSGSIILVGNFFGILKLGGDPLIALGEGNIDVFIAKFDANGNHLWSQSFGNDDDQLTFAVGVDASDNILWTGHFYQTLDFGGGPLTSTSGYDMYLVKFDSDGNHIWSDSYGITGSELATELAVDVSGNVIVTGRFDGTVNFGGGVRATAGFWDVFLVKFSPEGTHLWSRSFGDPNFQQVAGVDTDSFGNVFLTGDYLGTVNFGGVPLTSAGGFDIFLAKYGPSGIHIWSNRFGDASTQHTEGIACDAADNVVIAGNFSGSVDLGGGPLTNTGPPFPDILLAKFDPQGSHLWSQRFGDAALDTPETIALDRWDNILLSGRFIGAVDFGGGPLPNAGTDDVFLAKFAHSATSVGDRLLGPLEIRAYPNPFNPTTTLAYQIPKAGFVTLQVYDVNGRLVETLVRAQRSAGDHAVTWKVQDGDGASGVYFARLTFDGTTSAQKIVLLK